jgi:hypothetical protein
MRVHLIFGLVFIFFAAGEREQAIEKESGRAGVNTRTRVDVQTSRCVWGVKIYRLSLKKKKC